LLDITIMDRHWRLGILAIALALAAAAPAQAEEPSAAVPPSVAGLWQGTASEYQSPYLSTGTAKVTLDLRPDGTWTETWKQRDREWSASGTWHARGRDIVLDGREPAKTRLRLRRSGDVLYGMAAAPLPAEGRVTTEAIELHQVR
jgi:hypothetical protein